MDRPPTGIHSLQVLIQQIRQSHTGLRDSLPADLTHQIAVGLVDHERSRAVAHRSHIRLGLGKLNALADPHIDVVVAAATF